MDTPSRARLKWSARSSVLALLWLLLFLGGASDGARAEGASAASDTTHVAYISGTLIYLEVGRAAGLREGDRLEVLRDGSLLGAIAVEHLSSRRAACVALDSTLAVRAGDHVRFQAHRESASAGAALADSLKGSSDRPVAARTRSRGWMRDHGLRGRIGLRLLAAFDHVSSNVGYQQPAGDFRLDGTDLGGAPIDLSIDARARRTLYESGRADRNSTKVYRLAVTRRAGRYAMTAGRQLSSTIGSVGAFDGLACERRGEHWSFGALTGAQPEPVGYGLSSEVLEHGLFARWESGAPNAEMRRGASAGFVGSYRHGQINREYLALQLRLDSPRHSLFLGQEADLNRGWKRSQGEPAVSFTSSFAQMRRRLTQGLALSLGYDNRRSVRLYRDRVTPETDFDDTYRQGGSLGLSWEPSHALRFSGEARSSAAGGGSSANAFTGTASATRLSRWNLGLRGRTTRYENEHTRGWLHTLTSSIPLSGALHLDLEGGTRHETSRSAAFSGSTHDWFGLDLDASLSRHLYLLLSEEREVGDGTRTDRVYGSLAYRF